MENSRTIAQDAAKGLMIIAVVFFHCYFLTFENPVDVLDKFNIVGVFFPFVLSAFFFYAGYNYVPKGRSFKESVIRRAKQLLIPFVICQIITIVTISSMELAYDHNDVGSTFQAIWNTILYSWMSEPLALMIGSPQEGGTLFSLVLGLGLLWFLYCLFVCSIFFYLLVEHTNKKATTLISVVLALLTLSFCLGQFVGVYLPYTVQCYPVVLAIMLTASYLRQSHFLTRRIKTRKDIAFHVINALIAEGIVVGICLFSYYYSGAVLPGSLPGGKFNSNLRGIDAFVTFLFAFLGTYFVHTVSRMFRHIPVVGTCLQWLGNRSAVFYLFHPIPLIFAQIVFFQKKIVLGVGQAFIYFAFVFACLILICLLIDYFIKKKHVVIPIKEEVEANKDPEVD